MTSHTTIVGRPDPRLATSWCREGDAHDHEACGSLWDSSQRDTEEAARWADDRRAAAMRVEPTDSGQPQPVSARVAANVRTLRRRHRLSAKTVADRTAELGFAVPRSVIANLETGRRDHVSVDELVVLAEVFDVEPAVLLTDLPPACDGCGDKPPCGFTCNACGAGKGGGGGP